MIQFIYEGGLLWEKWGDNMLKLEQLLYIKTIAEQGSISKAAEKLLLSQPYLSSVIKSIEEELGVILFLRQHKGIVLTESGEQFLLCVNEIEKNLETIYQLKHFNQQQPAQIAIASVASLGLHHVFQQFKREHSNTDTVFIYQETSNQCVIDLVASNQADLGIIFLSSHHEKQSLHYIEQKNMMFYPLFTESAHVMLYNRHPLANQEKLYLQDCMAYPLAVENFR